MCIVSHALRVKAYNRGVRIHKIMHESMSRRKWMALADSIKNSDLSQDKQDKILDKGRRCLEIFEDVEKSHKDNRRIAQNAISEFINSIKSLQKLMDDFVLRGKACSDTFVFWESYTSDFSQLLLDYIADDDNRALEMETFVEMIPLDFQCGHVNYARWGCVNVAEGKLLQEEKQEIYQSLIDSQGAVYRTKRPFSGVWHDVGIEQSLNKDCGKYQHLTTNEKALTTYYLTAHYKAGVTALTKEMSGIQLTDADVHKEASGNRIDADEQAINDVIKIVTERMVNPFIIEEQTSTEDKQLLVNIAASTVAEWNQGYDSFLKTDYKQEKYTLRPFKKKYSQVFCKSKQTSSFEEEAGNSNNKY